MGVNDRWHFFLSIFDTSSYFFFSFFSYSWLNTNKKHLFFLDYFESRVLKLICIFFFFIWLTKWLFLLFVFFRTRVLSLPLMTSVFQNRKVLLSRTLWTFISIQFQSRCWNVNQIPAWVWAWYALPASHDINNSKKKIKSWCVIPVLNITTVTGDSKK